jgi:hypothetical protein
MTLKGLIIAAGMAAVAATPAVAGTNAKAGESKASANAVAEKEKKYCVQETDTGTRLNAKECRTKAEWAREGINIEEFVKGK